jgi:hypothetical protein
MQSHHDINLALELAADHGHSLVKRFRHPEPREEVLVALKVWRRWERNVSEYLTSEDRETFLSFGSSTPVFPVAGLRLEIADVIEKQLTYLREVTLIDAKNSGQVQ